MARLGRGLVSTDAGRAHVQKAWKASIIALERAKSSGVSGASFEREAES